MSVDRKSYWEDVYANKKSVDVSWYQNEPVISLELIASTGIRVEEKVIDLGGGASILVDKLLEKGFKELTVFDISSKALNYAKERLGQRAEGVTWIESDVTEYNFPVKYDLWHDRAVFHFLTSKDDQKKYVQSLIKALNPGGHVIIASFSMDGPTKCSGLKIVRYSPEKIKNELGGYFELIKAVDEVHLTPRGKEQKFTYFLFKKRG